MAFFTKGQVIPQLIDFIGQWSISRFLLVEAKAVEAETEAIGMEAEAEAVDEIAASTSLSVTVFTVHGLV